MASPTSSSAVIIPTPFLSFQSGMQPVTCESLKVAWFYTGPDSLIDLIVTNVGVPQDVPEPSLSSSVSKTANTFSNSRRAVPTGASTPILSVTTQIASDVNPLQLSYTWSSVNIAEGWYQFDALMPEYDYNKSSSAVYVFQGSDTSCLDTTPSSSSSTSPSSTSSTPTPSSSSIVVPIAGSSHTSVGTIIGVSMGAVALISMVLAAWLCLHRRGRGPGALGVGTNGNRWNGLSSVDSRMLTNSKTTSGRHHQARTTSIGTIPVGSEEAVGAEKSSVYGKHNDAYSHLDGPGVALSTMPVLQHQTPRAKRTYSASSSTSNVFSSNEHIPASGAGRKQSVPDSVLGRRSIDSTNTYPPVSPSSPQGRSATTYAPNVSRSPSLSTNLTHQQNLSQSTSSHAGLFSNFQMTQPSSSHPRSDPSSPVSPTTKDAAKDSKRHSLGGRKRKPVPVYDPNQDPLSPSIPSATPSVAPSPVPPPSPTPEPPSGSSASAGGAHYATRNQSGKDNSEHELVHKSSFGPGGVEGKPLHYLIPDMPMAMRE